MGKTVVHGCFEWDEEKNAVNIRKHGISFEEAVAIFDDPHFLELRDDMHSTQGAVRYLGLVFCVTRLLLWQSTQNAGEHV